MKVYEIINPSDQYTLECEEFLIGAVAVALLGKGHYGIEGSPVLFGWDEFFKDNKIEVLSDYVDAHLPELVACLDSVLIGSQSDRLLVKDAISKMSDEKSKTEYLTMYHDKKRSSMNDIGQRAKELADALRERI